MRALTCFSFVAACLRLTLLLGVRRLTVLGVVLLEARARGLSLLFLGSGLVSLVR